MYVNISQILKLGSIYSQACINRSHLGQGKMWSYKTGGHIKRGSIHMKCSMTGDEKGDLLIQVAAY